MFGQQTHSQGSDRFRRLVGRAGVGALLMGSLTVGTVAITSQLAAADSAFPTTATGSAVVNEDGSITVTVHGEWQWDRQNPCSDDRWGTGWAIDWHDANQPGNFVGTIGSNDYNVGSAEANSLNPADNAVHYGDMCDASNTGTWGPISHTYAKGTTSFSPCAVTYDLHIKNDEIDSSLIAAGPNNENSKTYNKDNSVEDSSGDNVCASIELTPHLELNKIVINDDGGKATIADFTLTATAQLTTIQANTPVINGADPDPSPDKGIGADVTKGVTYVLSESGPTGYTASDWVCTGGKQDGNTITLAAGELANCVITNNDKVDEGSGANLPTTTTTTLVAELPATGSSSGSTVLIAGFGVLLGFGMTMFARRRRPA